MHMQDDIARKVRELHIESGLSDEEAAAKANMDVPSFLAVINNEYEDGHSPSLHVLERMLAVYDHGLDVVKL